MRAIADNQKDNHISTVAAWLSW